MNFLLIKHPYIAEKIEIEIVLSACGDVEYSYSYVTLLSLIPNIDKYASSLSVDDLFLLEFTIRSFV